MKLFIIVLVSLAGFSQVQSDVDVENELQLPDKKLINPDFLLVHAWEYHAKFSLLQDDINLAIYEVQTAVSDVLKESTKTTLKQYEDHINAVQDEYKPHLERFNELKPGQCRDDAEFVLNRTTTNTGYRASNCAYFYDNQTRIEIDVASQSLVRIDELFSQVQYFAVKSFIGQNIFLTPEDVKHRIIAVYEMIEGKWNGSRPEVEAVKRNLASAIELQNVELGKCHDANLDYAKRYYEIFRDDVDTCKIFDETPDPFAGYVSKKPEYEAMFAEEVEYIWQAMK